MAVIPKVIIVGILAILLGVYYRDLGNLLKKWRQATPTKVMLEEHIHKYKHVVVYGHVFDVSSAPKFYGPNGHYNFLTGGDMTRAFANSDLSGKSFISTVDGLPVSNLQSAFDWLAEFKTKYPQIGVLHGLYFDVNGNETPYLASLREAVRVAAETRKAEDQIYPSCNVFSQGNDESEVDCHQEYDDNQDRYPRIFITAADRQPRCACVARNFLQSGRLRVYPGCSEVARNCRFRVKDLARILAEIHTEK